MKTNLKLVLLLAIPVIFILIFTYFAFFRSINVDFNITPPSDYSVTIKGKTYKNVSNTKIALGPGRYRVLVKAQGFDDLDTEITVSAFGNNSININMENNKIEPTSLAQISGVSGAIKSSYSLSSVTLFEDNTWLTAILKSKSDESNMLSLAAKRVNKKWQLVVEPNIEFAASKLKNYPKSVVNDLETFSVNYIGEPNEKGGPP